MGSPSCVLGIHRNNGFAKKPGNRQERIEMKAINMGENIAETPGFVNDADDQSPRVNSNTKTKKAGNKTKWAPNTIKKAPRHVPRRLTQTKKRKDNVPRTPSKRIRGMSLYQFTESARTLRSAVQGSAKKEGKE